NGQLWLWNRQAKLGHIYDSSTGFRLPHGAIRSPDAAWVCQSSWDALTPEQRKKWVPLCPDFVVELKSPSDDIADLQTKMLEYQENGLKMGWFIDPDQQVVEVYQADRPVELLNNPQEISADGIMSGFVLKLAGILTT
ncbi:MAG: Uma2 family endonuclease, partial [Alkalinema sp. CAN_BIN05]|nr:Uma2 family endonuclease [Alkalinema sp. CAN_BIN05]